MYMVPRHIETSEIQKLATSNKRDKLLEEKERSQNMAQLHYAFASYLYFLISCFVQ